MCFGGGGGANTQTAEERQKAIDTETLGRNPNSDDYETVLDKEADQGRFDPNAQYVKGVRGYVYRKQLKISAIENARAMRANGLNIPTNDNGGGSSDGGGR